MVFIIVIDGIIGSGKSTLIDKMKEVGGDVVIVEKQPVHEWSFLEKFYNDPKKYALSLQIEVLSSYKSIYEKYKNDHRKRVVLVESFGLASYYTFAKMLNATGMLSDFEMNLLRDVFHIEKTSGYWDPSMFVHVECRPEVAMKRIAKLGRGGEDAITLEYLTDLHNHYGAFKKEFQHQFKITSLNNEVDGKERMVASDFYYKSILSKFTSCSFDYDINGVPGSGKTSHCTYLMEKQRVDNECIEQRVSPSIADLLEKRYDKNVQTNKQYIQGIVYDLQREYAYLYSRWVNDLECHGIQDEEAELYKFTSIEGVLSLINVFVETSYRRDELTDVQVEDLKVLYNKLKLPKHTDFKLVVYLRPSIPEIMKRIKNRNRLCEVDITGDYIQMLDNTYMEFLKTCPNAFIIEGDGHSQEEIHTMIQKRLKRVYFE